MEFSLSQILVEYSKETTKAYFNGKDKARMGRAKSKAEQAIKDWCLSKLPEKKETHKELVRQVIKVNADEYWYEGYDYAITEAKRNMEGK